MWFTRRVVTVGVRSGVNSLEELEGGNSETNLVVQGQRTKKTGRVEAGRNGRGSVRKVIRRE